MQKHCFPPIVTDKTRLLILGSLPGEASLLAQQYYAHPRNQFWQLISFLIGHDLTKLAYPDKIQLLTIHHIGLWDIIAYAKRQGSLDSNIRQPSYNDLVSLIKRLPELQAIAFNGQTAGSMVPLLPSHIPRIILPSSSPAHTLSIENKKAIWSQLKQFLIDL